MFNYFFSVCLFPRQFLIMSSDVVVTKHSKMGDTKTKPNPYTFPNILVKTATYPLRYLYETKLQLKISDNNMQP